MSNTRLGGRVDAPKRDAALGWLVTTLLAVLAVAHGAAGSYRWFVFTSAAVAIVIAPVVALRNPLAIPSWKLLALVAIPVVDATIFGESFLTVVATYVAVAAVALVVTVEIDRFTRVRMTHSFAVVLVVLTTLAVAGTWNVAQWLSDAAFGTEYVVTGRSQDAANRSMMLDFAYAALAGFLAGIVFEHYVHIENGPAGRDGSRRHGASAGSQNTAPDDEPDPVPPLLRGRLGVPATTVERLSRLMQGALAVLIGYGLVVRDLTTIVNGAVALGITFLPALLERDYRLPLEPGLVFWLTAAVFLHVLGSAGLYDVIGPWDNMTHTISASIVAAAGYAVVRAIDLHSADIYIPPTMLFVFILVFVLAFGVIWELFEFGVDTTAGWLGIEAVVAQHGIDDTIVDLVFDAVGAVVAAIWGSFYLTDLSHRIADRFDR